MKIKSENIKCSYIFFLEPFLPPFERRLFLPTAIVRELIKEEVEREMHAGIRINGELNLKTCIFFMDLYVL